MKRGVWGDVGAPPRKLVLRKKSDQGHRLPEVTSGMQRLYTHWGRGCALQEIFWVPTRWPETFGTLYEVSPSKVHTKHIT